MSAQTRSMLLMRLNLADIEEMRHHRMDDEDEAKQLLCMACEVPACITAEVVDRVRWCQPVDAFRVILF